MPEGDTIRRLADKIGRRFAGERCMRCITRDPRLVGIDLAGTTLVDVDAIGKHLLLRFAKEERVLGHLGQNTTGRRLAQADHWVYARHGRPCPVYG